MKSRAPQSVSPSATSSLLRLAMGAQSDFADDLGKLLLRLTLGGLMLFHGVAKLGSGTEKIAGMLETAGLPGSLASLVLVGEIVAPALVMLGLLTRPAALVIAVNMVVAVLLVHMGHFFALGKSGGWSLELQAFFFMASIVVAIMGAGRFSLDRRTPDADAQSKSASVARAIAGA